MAPAHPDMRSAGSGADPASWAPTARDFQRTVRARHPPFIRAVAADVRLICAGRGRRLENPSRPRLMLEALRLAWETEAFLPQAMYRAKARLQGLGVPVLPRLLHRFAAASSGICIGDPVLMHPGVHLAHGNIVIDGMVEIHPNVSIFPFATIGLVATSRGGPTLRPGVWVGTGAKVLGDIEVGEGARVGANAVVLADVPPRATVAGAPARVVRQRPEDPERLLAEPAGGAGSG